MSDSYARRPLQEDLVAATWPADPLTLIEVAEGEECGMEVPSVKRQTQFPNSCATYRQELALRKSWEDT